jgi:serine/threonine-protein kinase
VSPDGRRLAIAIDSGKGADIYVYDWQRDVQTRLTSPGQTGGSDPVWAADGRHLLFRSFGSNVGLWWVRTDGGGQPVQLLAVNVADVGPNALSSDGRLLIYSAPDERGNDAMWTVALDQTDTDNPKLGKPRPFFHSPAAETRPAFSSDGQWVAYQSDESGFSEIYVRAFYRSASSSSGKWQVSSGGGTEPVWSRSGRQLFFLAGGSIMVTDYQTANGTFAAGKARVWSSAMRVGDTGFSKHDVAPDGKRIAILTRLEPEADARQPRMNLLLNFFDEVVRLAPMK